jgi:Cu-processing system ATP-binding protein
MFTLKIEHLYKSFGKLRVLEDIHLELAKGQVVGVMGPNGSGKTTLMKCLLGLTSPDSGKVFFDGQETSWDPAYRKHFGYMPQSGRYPDNMTVKQLFGMLKDLRGSTSAGTDEELIEAYRIDSIYDKALGSLSGGTVQKVGAAVAFLFKPRVLILDEPTAGLDPLAAEILKEKIQKEAADCLILITSHILNDLDELASHVLFLNENRIRFFNSMSDLRNTYGGMRLGKIVSRLIETSDHAENN